MALGFAEPEFLKTACTRPLLRLLVLAFAVIVLPAMAAPARAENRQALVIGNSGYAVGMLVNPQHDAEAIAKALKAVGFTVTKLIDANQKDMRRAVVEFGRRLRSSDSVGLLYYAGHGVQVGGENFLIPIGADIKDEAEVAVEALNLNEILRTMARAESQTNIVILDACRNNPFENITRSSGGALTGGLAQVVAPAGTLIAFATAPGQVALDGEGRNSPYSAALAQAIPQPGLVLEEVFRRARRQVLAATGNKQTPWEHSSLTVEFYFRPKSAEPEASLRPAGISGVAEAQLQELRAWDQIKDQSDPQALRRHIEAYPGGLFADVVRYRLERRSASAPKDNGGAVAGWIGSIFGASEPDPEAETLLAEAVKLEMRGTPETDKEAFRLYLAAASRGLPPAMHQVARAYDRGRGVDKNIVEAVRWYRKAADLGHAPAMASLGTLYEFGEGVTADLAEALRLYLLAAEAGESHGMTSLGYLYQQGKGVAKDGSEARVWYGKAALSGNPRAMYNLALMHVRGEGGERDFAAAVRLLNSAIAKGHVGALRELAFLFDEGRGVARDPKSAADNLLAAYKAGNKDARVDLLVRPEAWSVATRQEIQRRLIAAGVFAGRPTGYFDPKTRAAIESYAKKG